jgi:hypothetical protein
LFADELLSRLAQRIDVGIRFVHDNRSKLLLVVDKMELLCDLFTGRTQLTVGMIP